MKITQRKISKKEKILKIFQTLFINYSKKFTSSELLQIAEDIIVATYKSETKKHEFGKSKGLSDYFTRDAFHMISECPWEVATRENELIKIKDYNFSKII